MVRVLLLLIVTSIINVLAIAGDILIQKTVTIHVNEKGQVTIDRVTMYTDDLAKEVQQRLWRSYMSTGKMVSAINLTFDEAVSGETRNEVLFSIKTAQEKTLTVLSLHKHKKRFENISSSKQEKIRKQFPVLFQREYGPGRT